ncbi:MAG TPA: Tat proofreading chaperone DmsD, partial [Coriobacteriia bacterium]|nr:Tat proofreading chaperone DmsD [Coriobacteriia bacterium]
VEAAASDWPFVDDAVAAGCLKRMHSDLRPTQGSDYDSTADEALIWEYRRLFIGPATKPAPPWGSVYTDWEMVVFGESTLALRQWMRENGIERLSGEGTPEDHIGLMLLLMAWIAENKPELLAEYLRLHLLTWSSHFLSQLEGAAEHSFYAGLARLAKESLEAVQRDLKIEVEYPRYYR